MSQKNVWKLIILEKKKGFSSVQIDYYWINDSSGHRNIYFGYPSLATLQWDKCGPAASPAEHNGWGVTAVEALGGSRAAYQANSRPTPQPLQNSEEKKTHSAQGQGRTPKIKLLFIPLLAGTSAAPAAAAAAATVAQWSIPGNR